MNASPTVLRAATVIVLTLACALARAQEQFCVMELNAENLFDPVDNPQRDDNGFLPESARRWTWKKLMRKLNGIAKVAASCGGDALPDIVALCEVENDTVMRRLTRSSLLRHGKYGYLITDGPDPRGINVGLLYRRVSFKPIFHESLRPDFGGLPRKLTRDVLHVTGRIATGDTLDVFVCHMPSRLDLHKGGRPYRVRVAELIRRKCDSVCRTRGKPNVIVAGDFNDPPQSPTFRALGAAEAEGRNAFRPDSLYSLINRNSGVEGVEGTYFHKGFWELFDNIVVNGRMLDPASSIHLHEGGSHIHSAPPLLTEKDGTPMPLRTYEGMRYRGGISDHLPVVARFRLEFR